LRRRRQNFWEQEKDDRATGAAKFVVRVAQLLILAGVLYILYVVLFG
jgi:hypothetical protein